MQTNHARVILEDLYASWERSDLLGALSYFDEGVEFAVHSAPGAASYVGAGTGRNELGVRLGAFLSKFEVLHFRLLNPVTWNGNWLQSRVFFRYCDRITRIEIDGTMRHRWRFCGDEVSHFELFHDAPRMRAFYDMAALSADAAGTLDKEFLE